MYKLLLNIRYFLWKLGFDFHRVGGYDKLHSLIHNNYHKDFTFLQIGANDGVFYDPIHPYVIFYNLKGYCLEPIDLYYNKLVNSYKNYPDIVPIKVAIFEKSGKINFHKHIEDASAPDWTVGMASLLPDHYKRNGIESSKIEIIEVDALTFDDFFKLYPMQNIDLLQIDAEGYDYHLIKMFPFDRYKPKIIHFEHGMEKNFMTKEQLVELINLLIKMDYSIETEQFDLLAFLR